MYVDLLSVIQNSVVEMISKDAVGSESRRMAVETLKKERKDVELSGSCHRHWHGECELLDVKAERELGLPIRSWNNQVEVPISSSARPVW